MSFAVKREFQMPDGAVVFQGTMLRGRDLRGMVGAINGSGDYVTGPWYRYIRRFVDMPKNPPPAYLHDMLFELRECEVFDLSGYHKRIGVR